MTGEIVETLYKCLVLDLSVNSLTGTLPHNLGPGINIIALDLHTNKLHGIIPSIPANCTQLVILDLGNNKINGTFPWWLVALPQLQVLVLRSNRLHGKLSVRKMKHPLFPQLHVMDLSHNQFCGSLPIYFFDNLKVMADSDIFNAPDQTGHYYEASVSLIVKGIDLTVKKILNKYAIIDL